MNITGWHFHGRNVTGISKDARYGQPAGAISGDNLERVNEAGSGHRVSHWA